jgi:hypothetical protein
MNHLRVQQNVDHSHDYPRILGVHGKSPIPTDGHLERDLLLRQRLEHQAVLVQEPGEEKEKERRGKKCKMPSSLFGVSSYNVCGLKL